jgi:hypothetical protein
MNKLPPQPSNPENRDPSIASDTRSAVFILRRRLLVAAACLSCFAAVASSTPALFGAEISFESFPVHAGETLDLDNVAFGGGLFLATSSANTYMSSDGRDWSIASGESFNGFAYGNGQWLAVRPADQIYTSLLGRSWVKRTTSDGILPPVPGSVNSLNLSAAAYGDGYFAAVGSGLVGTSRNSVDWWASEIGRTYEGVAYGAGRFVAVARAGYIATFNHTGTVVTGPNRVADDALWDVCRSPEAFVAVGSNGTRLRSSDGLSWTRGVVGGVVTSLGGVAYGAGLFLAVGERGTVLVSSNGLQWDSLRSGVGVNLNKVAFGQGRFVVVGDDGQALRSISLERGCVRFVHSSVDVEESAGTARLKVVREGGVFGEAEVRVTTSSGSARAGEDFESHSEVVRWSDGEGGEKPVNVDVRDDAAWESAESFLVALGETTGVGRCGAVEATVHILGPNDEPPGSLVFKEASVEVQESAGTVRLVVDRVGGSAGNAEVGFEAVSGGATVEADFEANSGTLSWRDGDATPRTVEIRVVDDRLSEPTEEFTVVLRDPTGATLGSPATATVRILGPNDAPAGSVAFVVPTVEVDESVGTLELAVARTGGSAGPATVGFEAVAGSATPREDYSVATGVLTWGDGESGERRVRVQITDDLLGEQAEEFTVILKNAAGVALGAPISSTIRILGPNDLGVQGLTIAVSQVRLCWAAVPTRQYQVQYQVGTFGATSWADLGAPITATDTRLCVTDAAEDQPRFYRVVELP